VAAILVFPSCDKDGPASRLKGAGGCACKPDRMIYSWITVSVKQQPVGGLNKSFLSCTYDVNYVLQPGSYKEGNQWILEENSTKYVMDPPKSITLLAVWLNDAGAKYNETKTTFGLEAGDSKNGTYSTSFSAKPGMVLDKTFHVSFEWVDNRIENNSLNHKLESAKAVCTVR
jgi:hypothetical protein